MFSNFLQLQLLRLRPQSVVNDPMWSRLDDYSSWMSPSPLQYVFGAKRIWLVVSTYTYPSEKYESAGIMKLPTEWKKKQLVPNHQPGIVMLPQTTSSDTASHDSHVDSDSHLEKLS
jgi:hypothetical protein